MPWLCIFILNTQLHTQARRHTPHAPSPPRPGSLAPVSTGGGGLCGKKKKRKGGGKSTQHKCSCSNKVPPLSLPLFLSVSILFSHSKFSPFVPTELERIETALSAQLLCATYRVSPIVMGKFVVVNTGHYPSRFSLRDVSMAWKGSPKCREL